MQEWISSQQFVAYWATGMLFLETRLCEAESMGNDLLFGFVSSSVWLKLLECCIDVPKFDKSY